MEKNAGFENFNEQNGLRINKALNKILLISLVAGPALALGIFFKSFLDISYESVIVSELILLVFAVSDTYLLKKYPFQKELKYFALFGIEVFVATLTYYHVGVYLLFFLVPVLSLLFCDKKIYLISSGFAYVCAFILIIYNADYNISNIGSNITKGLYLRKTLGFFSLEFFIMCVAGFIIVTVMTSYLRSLFEDMQKVTGVEIDVEADPLTGLWPKPYLEKCYEKYVLEQKHQSALVILELDNLKELNEEYDEYTGDRALCAFADVLRETFRVSDLSVICRVGGPKFAVLVPLLEDESDLEPCLARLQRNVYYRMSQTKEFKNLTASIGASFGIQDGADFYTVYNKAESALHIVKMSGKNDYHIYQPGDTLIFSRK